MKKILYRIKRKITNIVEPRILSRSQRSRFMASLYYAFFNDSFHREHRAVIAGKIKHLKESRETKNNYFLLTRNTHRIEKGLLMVPRRPVFARDYIGETIDSFEGIWKSNEVKDNVQLKWFHDVLESYFHECQRDEYLDLQFTRFKNIVNNDSVSDDFYGCETKSIPYKRLDADRSLISFDEFYKLTRQRRSVRWFLNKPVPRDLIDKAILAGNLSPSACNRQAFEFRVFDQHELVDEVVSYPMGTKGYAHSVPVMVVLVGNLDAYFDERDRHVIYIDASLAAMPFMLALETLGLSSCAINWPDIEERERKMDKFLRLGKHQRALMCMGVGYPDPNGLVAFSEKRPIDLIRKYNYE